MMVRNNQKVGVKERGRLMARNHKIGREEVGGSV